MGSSLALARSRFAPLRFPRDTSLDAGMLPDTESLQLAAQEFYFHNLLVTERTVPSINDELKWALEKLEIDSKAVQVFVYSSPEVQAHCFPSRDASCIVRLSSGLIHLLKGPELRFVIGHELAHHLFQHSSRKLCLDDAAVEDFLASRYQEISADRVGLIASGSIDPAVRALLKTASGLDDRYLKVNVARYISQLRKIKRADLISQDFATHPPLLIRCRSLLWFSMVVRLEAENMCFSDTDLRRANQRIEKDFDQYIDVAMIKRRDEMQLSYTMWQVIRHIFESGSFTKASQIEFSRYFGDERLESARTFLQSHPGNILSEMIGKNIDMAEVALRKMFSRSWPRLLEESEKIQSAFTKGRYRQRP